MGGVGNGFSTWLAWETKTDKLVKILTKEVTDLITWQAVIEERIQSLEQVKHKKKRH